MDNGLKASIIKIFSELSNFRQEIEMNEVEKKLVDRMERELNNEERIIVALVIQNKFDVKKMYKRNTYGQIRTYFVTSEK
ncbi:hypothetical protein MT881_002511 [Enterococcus faecium]|nr:hypothetical protein [Enterococcus faecium]